MTDKSDENARKIIAAGREIVVLVLHAAPNPFFYARRARARAPVRARHGVAGLLVYLPPALICPSLRALYKCC